MKITREDLSSLSRAFGRGLRTYVAEKLKDLVTREELEQRLRENPGPIGPAGPQGERGIDGKTPEVEPIISAVLSKIPPPREGQKGEKGDPGESVTGPAGPRGERGVDGQTPDITPIIGAILEKIPPPQHGRDGKDGQTPEIEPIVAAVLERIPKPRDGRDGDRGLPGESIQGPKGDRGEDGKTPEIETIIAAVLQRIPTPKDGRDGNDGESIQGPKGDPGESIVGPQGERGLPGESIVGPAGPKGERGEPGIAKDGRDGRDGKDGRDASEIEIVRSVDESRKYRRGTLGIINRSICVSTGDGWEELIPPSATIVGTKFEKVNRVHTLRVMYSDGREDAHAAKSEEMIYRGVWADGEFERGDTVTHNGSLWHCQAGKTRAKPGTSGDWKLCTKRGSDGRSINGDDKENPVQELLVRISALEARLAAVEKPPEPPKPEVPAPSPVALTFNQLPPKVSRTKKSGRVSRNPDGSMKFDIEEENVEDKDGTEHQDG